MRRKQFLSGIITLRARNSLIFLENVCYIKQINVILLSLIYNT